jgi:ABC-type multidrug transport system ATPase subunit
MTGTAIQPRTTTTTPTECAVRTIGLWRTFDQRPIVRGIDLEIAQGEYVAILGANGAGKSTLLNMLAGLLPPTKGRIELFSKPLTRSADGGARRAR